MISNVSLPVRGAWIEIVHYFSGAGTTTASLPVRGAWIEIALIGATRGGGTVAPRAGSVD